MSAAVFAWYDETNRRNVGGDAMLQSTSFATGDGATNILTAIVDIDKPTTYYIRQESGDMDDDISPK